MYYSGALFFDLLYIVTAAVQLSKPLSALLKCAAPGSPIFLIFFKMKLVSSTQQLILLTLFIIRPVSSDQTDFIRHSNKMSKGN